MGSAQTICRSGPLSDTVIQVKNSIDTYNVYDCQLSGQVLFNDSTIQDPQYPPFFLTTINVADSTVAAGGFLGIMSFTFLNKTAASIQQGLAATIENNVFLLDSYFQVNGSLPQGSSLTFQNNTMSASARNPLFSLQGLALFVLTGTMFESAAVSLTSNHFSISGTGSQVGSAVIAHDITMRAGSSISVSDNNFEWSGVTGSALTFDGVSNVTSIAVEGNSFIMTTAASLLATGQISGNGNISFSGNNASLSATTDQAILPMAYPSTSVFVEDNTIRHNSDTFIAVEEWVSEPLPEQNYSFNVNRNTLHKVSGSVSTPIITFGRFSLPTDGSVANFSGNKVTSPLNTAASVLVAATSPSCTPATNVSIFFQNNSLPWANEPTAAQLFSHSLLGLATGQCPTRVPTSAAPTVVTLQAMAVLVTLFFFIVQQ